MIIRPKVFWRNNFNNDLAIIPPVLLSPDFKSSIPQKGVMYHHSPNYFIRKLYSTKTCKQGFHNFLGKYERGISSRKRQPPFCWERLLIRVMEAVADKQTEGNQSWFRSSNKQTVNTFWTNWQFFISCFCKKKIIKNYLNVKVITCGWHSSVLRFCSIWKLCDWFGGFYIESA